MLRHYLPTIEVFALFLVEGILVIRQELFLLLLRVDPVARRTYVVRCLTTFRASSEKYNLTIQQMTFTASHEGRQKLSD